MKRSLTIAAVMALLVAGPSFGASAMNYTIELGGNNHAAAWENGTNTPYTRAVNGDQDGQSFTVGSNINWAVIVEVSGTHETTPPGGLGDGLLPAGVANMVFDLELRSGSPTGPLVNIGHATVVNGQATTAGFWSSINDGDCEGVRCILEGGPSPEYNAAYAIAFNIGGNGANGGRVFDNAASGGPYVDFHHYPSAQGLPANSTAPAGKLVGMGAGYKEFKPISAGGQNTAGVGLTTNSGACTALGIKPIFEGQINTTGLTPGTYVLVLKAGTGNNVLPGHSAANPICTFGPPGRFAMAPNAVGEDTITFTLTGGCTNPPVLQTARSIKTHGAAGTFGVNLLTGNKVEGRTNTGGNPLRIEAVYDQNVSVSGASASAGSVTATAVGNTITLTLSGFTPNSAVTVSWTATAGACNVNNSVCVVPVIGDVTNDRAVNIFDLVQVRNNLSVAVTAANFRADVTADGTINIFDMVNTRNNLSAVVTPCP